MRITRSQLKEIIREELKNLNESPMGRAQMHAKSLTKDALRLLTYLKKGDVEKVNYFVEKLSNFLLEPTIGAWRDKALLIADDEHKNGVNQACEIKHTINSDILYDILYPYKLIYISNTF